jgi:sulfatase modifying factor 1
MKSTTALPFIALALCCSSSASADSFGSGANMFEIEFVAIGNPGNTGDPTGGPVGAGSVGYVYEIGKYEVSRDMFTKASAEGGLGITMNDMTSLGGNGANKPATGMSWNEAARFVNWLNASQGYPLAYKFSAQPGQGGYDPNANILLWQPSDPGYNPANLYRNSLARYCLPNYDEWFKAAYYDPILDVYYDFPTGSNTAPTSVSSGTATGSAIYNRSPTQGPADIDQAGGLSPYGTMGQGGNLLEWIEGESDLSNNNPSGNRMDRGGFWASASSQLLATGYFTDSPQTGFNEIGFRVMTNVPEPASVVVALLGIFLVACFRHLTRRCS